MKTDITPHLLKNRLIPEAITETVEDIMPDGDGDFVIVEMIDKLSSLHQSIMSTVFDTVEHSQINHS